MVTVALIWDTFREAFARKIFWGIFALFTLMIAFFLFILKIDIVQGAVATVTIFGQASRSNADLTQVVRSFYAGIATFLYTFAMALAVFASAGLVPSVLEPGRIELLLSKPVRRTHILLGRYAGNVLLVAIAVTYLVLGVWILIGLKSGIWSPSFLVAIPNTVFSFAVLLSIVMLTGVLWESAALSTMIAVAVMIISPILAQTRLAERLLSSQWSRNAWMAIYYALPKVSDVGHITLNIVFQRPVETWMPVWTSALFGVLALAASLIIFSKRDF
jgi:ABC-2 type transport system permease protein